MTLGGKLEEDINILSESWMWDRLTQQNRYARILKQIEQLTFTHDTSRRWGMRIKKTSIFILQ